MGSRSFLAWRRFFFCFLRVGEGGSYIFIALMSLIGRPFLPTVSQEPGSGVISGILVSSSKAKTVAGLDGGLGAGRRTSSSSSCAKVRLQMAARLSV